VNPSTVNLIYHGAAFTLNLAPIREALTVRELADGLNLAHVAQKAGISRMSLWRLLDGRRVSLPTLRRVLAALDVDPKAVLRAA
jgi:transcriptional regulator with XRE-family HTH domain